MKKAILTEWMVRAIELMNCGYTMQRDPLTLKVELVRVRMRIPLKQSDFTKLWSRGYIYQKPVKSNLQYRVFALTEPYKSDKETFTCPECGDFAYRCTEYTTRPGGGGSFTNTCAVCDHSLSDSF